ncbi:MAG: hypothetical protein A3J93_00540 [Candidatus Magasanikbacteria bacterium RIFOXYC2_FULL_42_28]|uniref:Uncharacterized protein n=1 Tax=Candidatus Magasanikbacteria bacterium RIFOXYC2_FULL_42_28 TaxID=1798704 RepID=A0A1F6NX42_9BACT|nr:MAG: hypothetical protein A3J93_00540 [Candidatus Magasanikbacteria bacterium RIFOXYC2_FULL_42_28]
MPKYNFRQLSNLLAKWGQSKQQLPVNNDTFKEKVISTLKPGYAPTVAPRRFTFVRLSLASVAGLYAIFLIVSPYVNQKFTAVTSYPESYYDTNMGDLGLGYAATTGLGEEQTSALYKFTDRIDFTNSTPITDTREFLKTGYQAKIKTRKVQQLGGQIQTMVRGYGGRIDSSSLNSKYGNISFVMPKSALESFQNELKGIVSERFLDESTSARNLLSRKQSVEKQTDSTQTQLNDYEEKRDALIKDHDSKIASWNKQINTLTVSINVLNQEVTTDTARLADIAKKIANLNYSKNLLKQNIANENNLYQKNLGYYDSSISSIKSQLTNLAERDQAILDDVETVSGSVSLRFVSVIEMIDLYVSVRYVSIGLLVVLVAYLLRARKQDDFVLP